MTKEDIYDEEISPLMGDIINICRKNKVPFLASFQFGDKDDDECDYCTTFLDFGEASEELKLARNKIYGQP